MFSKTVQYAIHSVIYIGLHSSKDFHINLQEIAKKLDIPKHFLGKILQRLAKHNILKSMKGPNGGFSINRNINKLYLSEIIEAVDGKKSLNQCVLGFQDCSEDRPCPIHPFVKDIKTNKNTMLLTTSIGEICKSIEKRETFVIYSDNK